MTDPDDNWTDYSPPIVALAERLRADLEAIGWTVILLSNKSGGSLCLHEKRKGKLEKLPNVMIAYHPIKYASEFMGDGVFLRRNVREIAKPWKVSTRATGRGGTWEDEAPAVEAFLREASTYP